MTAGVPARLGRRVLLIAGFAFVLLVMATPPAGAHAVLEKTAPQWGGVLAQPPHAITLVYDEDVVPRYARVAVVSSGGQNLAGPPHVSGGVVVVPLRASRAGSYTVRWHMVASGDGHVTEGAFSFGVRTKPLPLLRRAGRAFQWRPSCSRGSSSSG